jgi:hypothetical protein
MDVLSLVFKMDVRSLVFKEVAADASAAHGISMTGPRFSSAC